jgi:uncharacterized YccA/Bax inhibitor family protein
MRTHNPVLNATTLDSFRGEFFPASQSMTVQGAATKALILLGLCFGTATMTFAMTQAGNPGAAFPWMIGGVIGGLVFALVTSFQPRWAPITAPLYALAEGLFIGAISGIYELRFHGIVAQASLATLGTLGAMLFAYKTGLIKPTRGFMLGVCAATGGIAMMFFVAMICSFFGIHFTFLSSPTPLGIGISLVIVVVAALNLIIDFYAIQSAAEQGAPKYYEWYTAFALMVTLVWLYLEMLRLLALISQFGRDK